MSVKDPSPRSGASTAPDSVTRDEGVKRPENGELSSDQIFHLLQNERRREVLRYLRNADSDRVRMRDIAESIAAAEHETSVEALSSKQRQRVYVPLYQNHLPKLDEEGVLDYEQDRGFVERKPAAAQLERHLWPSEPDTTESPSEEDAETESRSRWHLGAACVGAVLFGGATLDVPVLSSLPDVAVSAVVLCLLVAVALWQQYWVNGQ